MLPTAARPARQEPAEPPCGLLRQGLIEGGFMGRTNKLVDGCYSFWQGALFPLLQRVWPQYLLQAGIPAGMAAVDDAPFLPSLDIPPLPPLAAQHPAEQAAAEVHRHKVCHLKYNYDPFCWR